MATHRKYKERKKGTNQAPKRKNGDSPKRNHSRPKKSKDGRKKHPETANKETVRLNDAMLVPKFSQKMDQLENFVVIE